MLFFFLFVCFALSRIFIVFFVCVAVLLFPAFLTFPASCPLLAYRFPVFIAMAIAFYGLCCRCFFTI